MSMTLDDLLWLKTITPFPTIVCLCGSTRFFQVFQEATLKETLAGKIVLSVGCDTKADEHLALDANTKTKLDVLHLHKIDLADEILVLNVGGYIGESTRREIAYAAQQSKRIRWLELPQPPFQQSEEES